MADIGLISTLILGFLLSSSKSRYTCIMPGDRKCFQFITNIRIYREEISHYVLEARLTRIIRWRPKVTLMTVKVCPWVVVDSNSRSIRRRFGISLIINLRSWWYRFLNFFTVWAYWYHIFGSCRFCIIIFDARRDFFTFLLLFTPTFNPKNTFF